MATTFTGAQAQPGWPAYGEYERGKSINVYGEFTIFQAPVLNDVFELVKLPANARLMGLLLYVPSLDSSTGVTLDLGDSASAQRFLAASTIGQAGGYVGMTGMTAAAFGFQFTAETKIQLKVHVAPTGTASTSGVIKLRGEYMLDW